MTTRIGAVVCALVAAVAALTALTPGTASAAPKPPPLTRFEIAAKDAPKITVESTQRDELFQLLVSEVSWMSAATPQTTPPKAQNLGPKFSVTLFAKDKAQQAYDLYPTAVGGPRAFRPAKQPSGKVEEGWFYGRLTMPESLRHAGVPLERNPDAITGGIGGGFQESVVASKVNPAETVNDTLAQMRQLFLLNGAVLIVILFGLGGIAFLIRRRV